jgi:subtilisin family serine protease
MAVPQVAGVAALVTSVNPSLTAPQIKTILCTSADVLPALEGKVSTSGRLDAYKAVLAAQETL